MPMYQQSILADGGLDLLMHISQAPDKGTCAAAYECLAALSFDNPPFQVCARPDMCRHAWMDGTE